MPRDPAPPGEEPPPKKQRPAPPGQEPPPKKQCGGGGKAGNGSGSGGARGEDEKTCALCFKTEAETDEKALRSDHGCATCVAGAWSVCGECHGALLSRNCPVCRSPYQALELFPFPFSAHPPPDDEWSIFAFLLSDKNVCVWEPEVRRASFMLSPATPGASGNEGKHVAIAGVDLSGHTFGTDQNGTIQFCFDTSVWAILENDDDEQEDEAETIELVPSDAAADRVALWMNEASANAASGRAQDGVRDGGEGGHDQGGGAPVANPEHLTRYQLLTPWNLEKLTAIQAAREECTQTEGGGGEGGEKSSSGAGRGCKGKGERGVGSEERTSRAANRQSKR